MTTQQKQIWKSLGVIVSLAIFIIGVIFGAGNMVARNENDHVQLIEHGAKLQDHESRVQTLETSKAVQETDSKYIKETLNRLEQNSEEQKKILYKLLSEKRK